MRSAGTHPARAHGFRAPALPGPPSAEHRRYAGHHRRGRQELPLSGHPENARGIGRLHMTCDSVVKLIPLYFYGELMPEEEDQLEEHLHACALCTREMERQRALPRPSTSARRSFRPRCSTPAAPICWPPSRAARRATRSRAKGPWTLFLEALAATLSGFHRSARPWARWRSWRWASSPRASPAPACPPLRFPGRRSLLYRPLRPARQFRPRSNRLR